MALNGKGTLRVTVNEDASYRQDLLPEPGANMSTDRTEHLLRDSVNRETWKFFWFFVRNVVELSSSDGAPTADS